MKKVLFLSMQICLFTLAISSFAVGTLSLDKSDYEGESSIIVTVSDITEQMQADSAFVAIYQYGAEHKDWGSYKYPKAGTSSLEFVAPKQYGIYEIRLYNKDGQYDDTTFVTKVQFSVGGAVNAAAAVISLSKHLYAGGEKIIVTTSGITAQMVSERAFVAIYKQGAAHSNWGDYDYPKFGADQVDLKAPDEYGFYEIRLYKKDGEYTDETFVTKIAFAVGNIEKHIPGKIALERNSYLATGNIKVTVSEIPEKYVKDGAFIAIYKKGAKHSSWGAYAYPSEGNSVLELKAPNLNGEFEMRLYSEDHYYSDATFVMSVPFSLSGAQTIGGSAWAADELASAEALGIIPDILKGADLTRPITRTEFAAVSVKAYEALSGVKAIPVVNNPFVDTNDVEVLKAYAVGITTGVSANEFEPDTLLNREQAATMLTRIFKKVSLAGWTIQTDGNFTLPYTKPASFADDAQISSWAKESVYFMVSNDIIRGVGGNKFAPKNITSKEIAQGYANATREQALLIAVRMVENLR